MDILLSSQITSIMFHLFLRNRRQYKKVHKKLNNTGEVLLWIENKYREKRTKIFVCSYCKLESGRPRGFRKYCKRKKQVLKCVRKSSKSAEQKRMEKKGFVTALQQRYIYSLETNSSSIPLACCNFIASRKRNQNKTTKKEGLGFFPLNGHQEKKLSDFQIRFTDHKNKYTDTIAK